MSFVSSAFIGSTVSYGSSDLGTQFENADVFASSTPVDSADLPVWESLRPEERGLGLKAILFAEFHNVHGPIVASQWPEEFLPQTDSAKERLETTKDMGLYGTFLIPHEALSGHLCTWSHGRHTFLTCPVTYEDPKYFRNQYRTNLIFVFESTALVQPFHSVIRRVSQSFQVLERDFEWVSRQSKTSTLHKKGDTAGQKAAAQPTESTPSAQRDDAVLDAEAESQHCADVDEPLVKSGSTHVDDVVGDAGDMPSIGQVLRQIGEGLNTNHEAVIEMGRGEVLTFKYFPPIADPPEVHPWQVPVVVSVPSPEDVSEWDLALKMIVPRVNDKTTVAVLAHILGMPVQSCCFAVRHLVYYGYVKMIDVFQYSNIYRLFPNAFAPFSVSKIDQSALVYCSKDPADPISPVALINFFQAFGAQADDKVFKEGWGGGGALREFKRVETVLMCFDDKYVGGAYSASERKLDKWRNEWRSDTAKKLSVSHAGMDFFFERTSHHTTLPQLLLGCLAAS